MEGGEHISEEELFIKDVEENTISVPVYSHYHADFESLLNRCLIYKKAHSDCKSFHYMFDKIIKLSILSLSTITTYFISSHDEHVTFEDLEIDRKLTFATTLVSGINAIFNFGEKIDVHKSLNTEYLDLFNDIEKTIRLFSEKEEKEDIRAIYEEHYKIFRDLNKRTSEIGIIKYIKVRHGTT
tara:strand:- start:176 stop:724 length:549 start_codon:yes stop_codon:yes gene_type:complete